MTDGITITDESAAVQDGQVENKSQKLILGKFKSQDDFEVSYKELERKNTELGNDKADLSHELATELSAKVLSTQQPPSGGITAEIDLTDPQQLAGYLEDQRIKTNETLGNIADYAEIMAKNPTLSREQAIKIMERKGDISAGDLADLERLRKLEVDGTLGKTEEKTIAQKVISELDKSLGTMPGGDTGLEELQVDVYNPDAYAALTDEQRLKGLKDSSETDFAAMPDSMKF